MTRLPAMTIRVLADVLGKPYVEIESTDAHENASPMRLTFWADSIEVIDQAKPPKVWDAGEVLALPNGTVLRAQGGSLVERTVYQDHDVVRIGADYLRTTNLGSAHFPMDVLFTAAVGT